MADEENSIESMGQDNSTELMGPEKSTELTGSENSTGLKGPETSTELKGPVGACLLLLHAACVFYVLGLGSTAWEIVHVKFLFVEFDMGIGLFGSCLSFSEDDDDSGDNSGDHSSDDSGDDSGDGSSDDSGDDIDAWRIISPLLLVCGLVGLLSGYCLLLLYIRRQTPGVIRLLTATCCCTAILMFLGIVVYGANAEKTGWGLYMAVFGMCFTLAAGVASALQMRKSGGTCQLLGTYITSSNNPATGIFTT